jgi:hypothetical protein
MIAHIQKDDVPQVPAAINPTSQKNRLPRVRLSKFSTVVRSLSISKEVKFHGHHPKKIVNYK